MALTILYDGECPLCRREIASLLWLDRGRGRLDGVNIADREFDPAVYGLTREQAMGAIHAVGEDGTIVKGMEVFRRAYAAVGLGWLWAPTGWPLIKPLADRFYRWFARNRMRISLRSWRALPTGDGACATGTCKIE